MKPTWGPLPWPTTTSQPSAIIAATCSEVSWAATYWSRTAWCIRSLISEFPPIATTTSRLVMVSPQLIVSAMTAFWPWRRFSASS